MSPRFFLIFYALMGCVTAPLPAALVIVPAVQGVIGLAALVVSAVRKTYVPSRITGCEWTSVAPFCKTVCDSQQQLMRTAEGWNKKTGEEGWGSWCWTGSRAYCCKSNDNDLTWGGRWTSGLTGIRYNCMYHVHSEAVLDMDKVSYNCGFLSCHTKHPTNGQSGRSFGTIGKAFCDTISIYGMVGKAKAGHIKFVSKNGTIQDQWFK